MTPVNPSHEDALRARARIAAHYGGSAPLLTRQRALGLWVGLFLSPLGQAVPEHVRVELDWNGFEGAFETDEYGSNDALDWLEDVWKGRLG